MEGDHQWFLCIQKMKRKKSIPERLIENLSKSIVHVFRNLYWGNLIYVQMFVIGAR